MQKSGRRLIQFDVNALEKLANVEFLFPYVVTFDRAGVIAGNHFHKRKVELIFCLRGKVTIATTRTLDLKLDQNVSLQELSPDSHEGLLLKPENAHAVRADTDDAVILVYANHPAREPDDDFEYRVMY